MRVDEGTRAPGDPADVDGPLRTAIVHDWIDTWRGGERVLAEILALYPQAELFTLVDFLPDSERGPLGHRPIRTSFIQNLPQARSSFRRYLPLFPRAIESLDVSGFDLVISSSHAVAKGVRTRPDQLHVCYCYTPMRYAWDLQETYLAQVGLDRGFNGWLVRRSLARLRRWDLRVSHRVHDFVAISHHIARRIERCYSRTSAVIYPPVAMARAMAPVPRGPAYVTVSQFVPYKRIDAIVAAFAALPDRELMVIGDGPERERIAAQAGPNVHLLGQLPDLARDRWLAAARAFVFAAEEDFGIAPVEAQAYGTPVIAYGRGGVTETVRGLEDSTPTGVFFAEQTPAAIAEAIRTFEANETLIAPSACIANAQRFAADRFRAEFAAFVAERCGTFFARPAA
jgi:glycosyltransferase involved in cell wall biosynthesis